MTQSWSSRLYLFLCILHCTNSICPLPSICRYLTPGYHDLKLTNLNHFNRGHMLRVDHNIDFIYLHFFWQKHTILFACVAFVSIHTTITVSCPLVTCHIQAIVWTVVLAILSIVQTITLDTFPSDRITVPTPFSTFSTIWFKLILRTYCNDC